MMKAMSERLLVATFNLKHGITADGKFFGHPRRVAKACAALDADVLALQEVDRRVVRSGFADVAAWAGKAARMAVIFAETRPLLGGSSGNALLVRGKIAGEKHIVPLPIGYKDGKPGGQPRNAIVADVEVRGTRLSVAATHLSPPQWVNGPQLEAVVEALHHRAQPQLMLGDFNRHRAQMLPYLSEVALELVDGPPTYPALNPRASIDHIAVNGLKICKVNEAYFPGLSDHRALIAEVEL